MSGVRVRTDYWGRKWHRYIVHRNLNAKGKVLGISLQLSKKRDGSHMPTSEHACAINLPSWFTFMIKWERHFSLKLQHVDGGYFTVCWCSCVCILLLTPSAVKAVCYFVSSNLHISPFLLKNTLSILFPV